jgi:pimeloyl-ACP methyl ester carboxylesterase
MAKMGFSERLYLQYLRTKFKTINSLSPQKSARLAFSLFCTPYPKYKKRKLTALFHAATPLSVPFNNSITLRGFEWQPTQPNGQSVLIMHGYASFSFKFEQYITPLLKNGFKVICFDAPGHGISDGKYINALLYKQAIEKIIDTIGPINHFIGHSLGGLTAALIAENMPNPTSHKFVLIAPATKTTTTFENFFQMMHFNDAQKASFLDELRHFTEKPISYFEADRAISEYKGPVLWVHDQNDTICPYSDIVHFKNIAPNNIKYLITNNLGHNQIYKTQSIIDQIVAFISSK